jgi:hypothetical protein
MSRDKSTVKEAEELILRAFDKGLLSWRDVPKSLTWKGSGVVYWPYLGKKD